MHTQRVVADRNEKSGTMEMSNTKAGMPTASNVVQKCCALYAVVGTEGDALCAEAMEVVL